MSRIGKLPVEMPTGVKYSKNGNNVTIEGPKGKLSLDIDNDILVELDGQTLLVTRRENLNSKKSLHGLYRVLISNMVCGVSKGFEKKLEIIGTGFKANVTGDKLVLTIGYSHPVEFNIPAGIKITVEENTKLTIAGIDKQLVGQVAAVIRKFRKPEPYKGKGIKYSDEVIRRKAGKATKK